MIQEGWGLEKGLKCLVYRDYLSPDGLDYVLAFAGTEADLCDIVNDVMQGLGLSPEDWKFTKTFENQYAKAIEISGYFGEAISVGGLRGRTTGHSLGGGLASAASVTCEAYDLPANTFNAAGLHINTITKRYDGMLLPDVPCTPNAFKKYWSEKAMEGRIVAFSTEYDPLTFVQENLGPVAYVGRIPQAIGRAVRLQSPFDTFVHANKYQIADAIRVVPDKYWMENYKFYVTKLVGWLSIIVYRNHLPLMRMLPHHGIRAVNYGLMVESVPLQRRRLFDIFGYDDPDK
jgi:hypothetical protein